MTGALPYHNHSRDKTITRAIESGEFPSDLQNVDTPTSIKSVLAKCWQQDPGVRPTSMECRSGFNPWSAFPSVGRLPIPEIPLTDEARGNGQKVIHYANSQKVYEVEFVTVPCPPVEYVPWNLVPGSGF